jgi:two-component system sensor kinase FixL
MSRAEFTGNLMSLKTIFGTIKTNILRPPEFANKEKNRIAGMLHSVILGLFVATVLAMIALWAGGQPNLTLVLFPFLLVPLVGSILIRRGMLGQTSLLIIFAILVVQLYLLLESNGIYDIAIILYPLVILLSSLLLSKRLYLLVFGLVIASAIVAAFGASYFVRTYVSDLVILVTVLAVIAVVVDGLTSNLVTSLRNTRENEQKLTEANRQLTLQTASLYTSEARYRSLVENSLAGIFIINDNFQYVYVNQEMCRLLGYTEAELLGRNFTTTLAPESREMVVGRYRRRQQGGDEPTRYEFGVIRKDGQQRDIEISAAVVTDLDGNRRTIGQMLDITERKQTERSLQNYATKLERSNRELQEFNYIASHDLQEPLRKIQTFSDRIRQKYTTALPEPAQDYLNRIESAASRMQALIQALLNLSQATRRAVPFTPVSLAEVVEEVLSDLEIQISIRAARVEVGYLPTIEADSFQMYQLFQNLISNALKFQKEGQPPEVSIGSMITTDPDTGQQLATIKITDNGIGFEEKYLNRIFSVFQRLNDRGTYEGMGIGLAICRRVVDRHYGSITAVSRPNQGAAFIIRLPVKQTGSPEQEAYPSVVN